MRLRTSRRFLHEIKAPIGYRFNICKVLESDNDLFAPEEFKTIEFKEGNTLMVWIDTWDLVELSEKAVDEVYSPYLEKI